MSRRKDIGAAIAAYNDADGGLLPHEADAAGAAMRPGRHEKVSAPAEPCRSTEMPRPASPGAERWWSAWESR